MHLLFFMFKSLNKPKQLIITLFLAGVALLLSFFVKVPDKYDAKLGIQPGVPSAKAIGCGCGCGTGGSGACGCCSGTSST